MRIGRWGTTIAALAATIAASCPALAGTVAAPGARAPQPPARKPLFDLRLRRLTSIVQSTTIAADDSRLRHRLIGSMIDYFPKDGSGFFVSGGGQIAARAAIVRDVNSSLTRLLYAPGLGGLRINSKVAPAATMGYVESIGKGMEVRLEGGALLGRLNATPSSGSTTSGPASAALVDRQSHAANPVMRASFGLRF